jgi:hypothetical protein
MVLPVYRFGSNGSSKNVVMIFALLLLSARRVRLAGCGRSPIRDAALARMTIGQVGKLAILLLVAPPFVGHFSPELVSETIKLTMLATLDAKVGIYELSARFIGCALISHVAASTFDLCDVVRISLVVQHRVAAINSGHSIAARSVEVLQRAAVNVLTHHDSRQPHPRSSPGPCHGSG